MGKVDDRPNDLLEAFRTHFIDQDRQDDRNGKGEEEFHPADDQSVREGAIEGGRAKQFGEILKAHPLIASEKPVLLEGERNARNRDVVEDDEID